MNERPNIVLMMCDDLGYGDLGCYGGLKIDTPRIDSLAGQGIRFSSYYASGPICSPTRASCLTGCYPLRFNLRDIYNPWTHPEEHLPLVPTLPKQLKSVGYQTAHVGKWHLGGDAGIDFLDRAKTGVPGPAEHGFDYNLTNCHNEAHQRLVADQTLHRRMAQIPTLFRNDQLIAPSNAHSQDVLTADALGVIDRFARSDAPFFLNFWFLLPHTPLEPSPEEYLAPYRGRAKGYDLWYRSMVGHIDATVGKVLDKLDELAIADNTIVIFTSDHGPAHRGDQKAFGPGSAGCFRNGKHDLHEGGLRVPLIVRWPVRIAGRRVIDGMTHVNDLLPTLCQASGAVIPPSIDGQSRLPEWLGAAPPAGERGPLLFHMRSHVRSFYWYPYGPGANPTEAVRKGDWKLLTRDGEPVELYNLAEDPRESWNLLSDEPQRAEMLVQHIREFLTAPRRAGIAGKTVPVAGTFKGDNSELKFS